MHVASRFELCFMRFNNSLALGIKSLRHRVERAILKNLFKVNKNLFDGYCFLYEPFLLLKRERSLFYQMTYM